MGLKLRETFLKKTNLNPQDIIPSQVTRIHQKPDPKGEPFTHIHMGALTLPTQNTAIEVISILYGRAMTGEERSHMDNLPVMIEKDGGERIKLSAGKIFNHPEIT